MDALLIGFGKEENTDIAITQTLLPGIPHLLTVVITAVLTFAVMFLICYIFEYLLGEKYKVRKYNQMLAELDADED
jgi:hydrogenase-4 membrane subunit HyfE